jgi:hypothetical protein
MARIVYVHHVDKGVFLKENIELDQDELDMMFERTPNYVEVTEQVRIDLHCYEQVSLERNKKLIIDLHIYLFV